MQCKVFSNRERAPVADGEEAKCQKCGQTLEILHWSSGKDIFICNNGKCLAYRNPVPCFSTGNSAENKTSTQSNEENYQYAGAFDSVFRDVDK